ncbi:recombinase family protein [Holdemania massiliensis]|uniref:recombinase family protein n=1 Tax=Holdemania massiliensis TaxID=1468449 RepID=UPI003BAC8AFA
MGNQKESLKRYVESRRWPVIKYYVDRGYSGTNFERSALQEMLADAKEGLINLILVKDLSRIGTNYLLIGLN